MTERVRSIEEVLIDLENVAENCDNGWTAAPTTVAALIRRAARDIAAGIEKVREDERAAAFKRYEM